MTENTNRQAAQPTETETYRKIREEHGDIWAPVQSVIAYLKMDYAEAVTIGSQFGKLVEIIRERDEEIRKLYRTLDREVNAAFALEGRLHEVKAAFERLQQQLEEQSR